MKISTANVSMSSSRVYEEQTLLKTSSRLALKGAEDRKNNATFSLSDESKNLLRNLEKETTDRMAANASQGSSEPPKLEEDGNITALKKLLEMLKQMREQLKNGHFNRQRIYSDDLLKNVRSAPSFSLSGPPNLFSGSAGTSQLPLQSWTRITTGSSFHSEQEITAFETTGTVLTEDGRSFNFNLELSMTRSFMEETHIFTQETAAFMTDPLVINLGSDVTEVTDQKFLFDIDNDGEEEDISFVTGGSGFLAIDKNGDGKINNGSELFGTKSGDGFKDLAEYDKDNNGWIDENDDVFDKLLIWTKDKDGNDKLISAGKAGIGAIYLGSASTDFSLNNLYTNQTNAQIRKTGIFLKEDGGVGTVQHVDIAT